MVLRRWLLVAAALAFAVAPACSSDDDASAEGGSAVDVTLQEFAVGASTSSVGAGDITFNATNEGPEDEHELVIVKTDLAPTDLPTAEDGSVDEEGDGIEVIDEIEEFPVGESESLTVSLDAGSYVLICNIVQEEDDGLESHYQEGMRTSFTVT